ncbi:MAG: GYDIA family GHMP kinase [Weeksellaceae bacterium]
MTEHTEQTYFAHGKLLLTGEYVVLDGAKAIGLPTKIGQHLKVQTINNAHHIIKWSAKLQNDSIWFEVIINLPDFSIQSTTDLDKGQTITEILKKVQVLNPQVFSEDFSYHFETKLDFDKEWGLGSSSTLITLLSKFADINAFDLAKQTFGGSGYDISCAMMPKIQFYQLYKNQRKVNFISIPDFVKDAGYFIYLNQKQNSREGIQQYQEIPTSKALINSISEISEELIKAPNLAEFEDLLFVHESLIANHLEIPTIQEELFSDYEDGIIKSLGAWGGDFIFVTAENEKSLSYFKKKGFDTLFPWRDLIVE